MNYNSIDVVVIAAYFIVLMLIGFWNSRGSRKDSDCYFTAKGLLPWWAIGAAYVATGMNTEQLIGQNGVSYKIGLTMVNWYLIVVVVYSALIFIFFPIYLRNNIKTMPQYLGKRFDRKCEDVLAVILLVSYIFMNLSVVFYGGAKLLEVVFGLNLWIGLIILALVAGLYTMYGGMSSMIYAAFIQFIFIFASGFVLFIIAYLRLPNGWQDVIDNAPGGFHLIQPMNYELIPWHAIPFTIFGLHLFYSCMNQALVQRGFGAKTEWDVRMAIIFAGFFVLLRPFVEIFPGMIAKALAVYDPAFALEGNPVDEVFPLLIRRLIPAGFQGLIIVGILSSVMSTISAYLNSISTLFTYDIYKKWINKNADSKQLIKAGMLSTLALMVFAVVYSPVIEKLGGIFNYFQLAASYLAVPIATVFLFGIFWKRSSSAGALTVIIAGIPMGLFTNYIVIPLVFSQNVIDAYSLDNFFIQSGINQLLCSIIMVAVSLKTKPRHIQEIKSLLWSVDKIRLPQSEPKRPWYQSIWLWWTLFVLVIIIVYIKLW